MFALSFELRKMSKVKTCVQDAFFFFFGYKCSTTKTKGLSWGPEQKVLMSKKCWPRFPVRNSTILCIYVYVLVFVMSFLIVVFLFCV
jgi:hypothetical protein